MDITEGHVLSDIMGPNPHLPSLDNFIHSLNKYSVIKDYLNTCDPVDSHRLGRLQTLIVEDPVSVISEQFDSVGKSVGIRLQIRHVHEDLGETVVLNSLIGYHQLDLFSIRITWQENCHLIF